MTDKILFISHEASRTGAPIMLLNVLRWLRRNQTNSIRIVTGSAGALSSDFAAVGRLDSVEPNGSLWFRALRRLNLHHYWQLSHLSRLQRDLSNEKFGLVYVNSVASGRILDLLPVGECKVICHVHELSGAIRQVGVENIVALERRRPLYIAVSHAVKESLVSNFAIPPDRIEVIYGFVPSIPEGPPSPEEARRTLVRELNIPAEAKIVCGCGSIDPRKGTDLFLEVAARVLSDKGAANIHFVWVGGASSKVAGMRAQVANEGLAAHVHFVGPKVNTAPYFAAADVFLLPSREDPFPLVVMEAAFCGVPIVCFLDGGGAPELVGDDAGFCVPNLDVSEMSGRVLELVSSKSLRDQMGNVARRKVEARHTLELGAAKIASCIRDAMPGGGAGWQVESGSGRGAEAHLVGPSSLQL